MGPENFKNAGRRREKPGIGHSQERAISVLNESKGKVLEDVDGHQASSKIRMGILCVLRLLLEGDPISPRATDKQAASRSQSCLP
jgi:hypothetical protein